MTEHNWWKSTTCYQIWPMSYKDSNGDGIGDIPGAISTLDYLKDLGVDTVWLSPMYDSPQVDYGYDISDYQNVYAPFGTLADMDELIKQTHDRGMKLILDLVINHTSDQHRWFLESKKDKTNPKADWYIWRDPKYVNGQRQPPNNWRSIFGGPAWEYVPERDQYYLHIFVTEQPDLNWEREETRRAIYKEAIEFWLDKGIDGFRVDTVNLYSKNIGYPDAPIAFPGEPSQPAFLHFTNGPRMHEWLKEQRKDVLKKYGDVFMVGECPGSDYDTVISYVSALSEELSCVFDFDVVMLGSRHESGKKHQSHAHTLPDLKKAFKKVQEMIMHSDAWGTVFMENHDQGRSLSRFATDEATHREHAAKMLATLQCTLTGTLFLYQGQEIGTYNHPKHWTIEDIKDIDSLNAYNDIKDKYNGDELWLKKAMAGLQRVGRDNARLPVQWDSTEHAGFTSPEAKPWIRVHDDYKNVNVADQLKRQDSPLAFWKKMLTLRKKYSELLIFGDFHVHDIYDNDTFTFTKSYRGMRRASTVSTPSSSPAASLKDVPTTEPTEPTEEGPEEILVCCSFSNEIEPLDVPHYLKHKELELVVSSYEDEKDVGEVVENRLRPWEARVYIVK